MLMARFGGRRRFFIREGEAGLRFLGLAEVVVTTESWEQNSQSKLKQRGMRKWSVIIGLRRKIFIST